MKALFLLLTPLMLFSDAPASISSQEDLERLIAGNQRYVQDKLQHPNRTQESRAAVTEGQKPFAVILGCSDSRVAPEILFDQGIGDLFIVRVAGNVASRVELDSIDYAALHLGSSLVLVLGHEKCGAVNAVLHKQIKDIETVAALIEPAVAPYRDDKNGLNLSIEANVRRVVQQLKTSPLIKKLIEQKKIDVIGGYYHLKDGKVEILP